MPDKKNRKEGAAKQSSAKELGVRTARAASLLISGRFVSIIISAAMFIIVARLLQPHNYGIYVLIMSAATIISTIGNPNIGNYLKERIPRLAAQKKTAEAGTALGDAFLISLCIGAALLIISVIFGNTISTYFLKAPNYNFALDLGFISVLASLLYSTFNDALISINKSGGAAFASIVHSTIQAVTSVSLVFMGFGIIGALSGFSIGLVFAFIFELYIANKTHPIRFAVKGMAKRFAEAINFSKYLTFSGVISSIVSNFSTIYLSFFVLPSIIGDYGIAQKALSAIDVITGSIALALIPMFSEAKQRSPSGPDAGKLFYYSIYLSLLVATPVVLFISIFSHVLIVLLFSASYAGATLYMQLIMLSIPISIFGAYGVNFVIGIGEPGKVMKYTLITGLVSVAAMVPLTMYFGVVGTIAAIFYIGNIIPGMLYVKYILRRGAKLNLSKISRVILANAVPAIALSAMLLLNLQPILELVLGAIIYLAIYPILAAKFGAIEVKDIALIKESGDKLPFVGGILNAFLNYAAAFTS